MSSTLPLLNSTLRLKPLQNLLQSPSTPPKFLPLPKPPLFKRTQFPKGPNSPQELLQQLQNATQRIKTNPLPAAALALPLFLDSHDALAVGGEFGLLEGRSFALIHPLVMGGLFFYTLWAGYLGWQWRRVRTIQEEINELKKQVKPAVAVGSEASAEETVSVSPFEAKIQQLTEERKELIKGSYRDRHFNAGSILLGFGVFEAVGGGLNTWFRAGKLFPGPHLFAGAAL